MNQYAFYQILGRLFQVKMYLIAMTVYHLVAIYYFFQGIEGFGLQTLVGIDQNLIHSSYGLYDVFYSGRKIGGILSLSAILMFIDLIFLMIVSYDFRSLNLTMSKITLLEIIIFIVSLLSPEIRAIMLFLSLNTLQIFVFYHIAVWIRNTFYSDFGGYFIVTGSYIMLIKILTYPLWGYL